MRTAMFPADEGRVELMRAVLNFKTDFGGIGVTFLLELVGLAPKVTFFCGGEDGGVAEIWNLVKENA